jgi:hypothetical protein
MKSRLVHRTCMAKDDDMQARDPSAGPKYHSPSHGTWSRNNCLSVHLTVDTIKYKIS